ncbi:MAG: hypothetical protein J6D47_11360 [Peptostreptococcaceae bacterium]|nr:hypothetical protein [Peptostreptococcaceae bacterium]
MTKQIKKYKGANICCTCGYAFIRKDENCDPCDICYGYSQYIETIGLQCNECKDINCKYRECEIAKQ